MKGKIFTTLPDADHAHVMLEEERIREEVRANPAWAEELWWGKKLSAVRVSLGEIDEESMRRLLTEAWGSRRS